MSLRYEGRLGTKACGPARDDGDVGEEAREEQSRGKRERRVEIHDMKLSPLTGEVSAGAPSPRGVYFSCFGVERCRAQKISVSSAAHAAKFTAVVQKIRNIQEFRGRDVQDASTKHLDLKNDVQQLFSIVDGPTKRAASGHRWSMMLRCAVQCHQRVQGDRKSVV